MKISEKILEWDLTMFTLSKISKDTIGKIMFNTELSLIPLTLMLEVTKLLTKVMPLKVW
jgi:hypothetical protein